MLILIKGGMFMGKTTLAKRLQLIYPDSVIMSIAKRLKEEVESKKDFNILELYFYKKHLERNIEKDFYIRRLYQLYSDRKKSEVNNENLYCEYLLEEIKKVKNKVIIIDDVRKEKEIEFFRNNYQGEIEIRDLSLVYMNDLEKFKELMERLLKVYTPKEILILISHNSERENWDYKKVENYLKGVINSEL
jgi:hypothetical protein